MFKLNKATSFVAVTLICAFSRPGACDEPIFNFIKFVEVGQATSPRGKTSESFNPRPAPVATFQYNQNVDLNKSHREQHSLIRFLQPADALHQTFSDDEPQPLPSVEPDNQAADKAAEILTDHELKPIGALNVNIKPSDGPLPNDVAASRFKQAGRTIHDTGYSRPWPMNCYAWVAPGNAHRPLYFEDENLERYGYHWGLLQPAVSGAHFFSRIPAIPYMRGAWSPREKIYSLGYYRPGSCAPFYISRPPASVKGAAMEAAAVGGGILLVP